MIKLCACGCGQVVAENRQYISGHNLKNLKRTQAQCKKISIAQKKAWARSPDRLCFGRQPRKPLGSKSKHTKHGYVHIKTEDSCRAWRPEHIINIEANIGRKLKKKETIHHINGVRHDNELENLLLCPTMAEHNNVDYTFKVLLRGLMDDGIVIFNREARRYERKTKTI